MYNTPNNAQRARWEVRWAVKHKGKIRWIIKDCMHDFSLALRVYDLMKDKGAAGVTLRCKNMAFPPPDEFADPKWIIVRKKGKKYKKQDGVIVPRTYHTKMREVNLTGRWWCPYCIKFRTFRKLNRVGGAVMACPVCESSHLLGTVARYNPMAMSVGNMRSSKAGDR